MSSRVFLRVVLAFSLVMVALGVWISKERQRKAEEGWAKWERELEEKGEALEWQAFIPAPVPDEDNFFKVPEVEASFRRSGGNSVGALLSLPAWEANHPANLEQLRASSPEHLRKLREWFARAEDSHALLAAAARRPEVLFTEDYAKPFAIGTPHFVSLRSAAQAVGTHGSLSVLDGEMEVVVQDLLILRRLGELSGNSPTLVGGMIQVAIFGLNIQVAREAIESGSCSDAQLAAIQKQLCDMNLVEVLTRAIRVERAAQVWLVKASPEERRDFQEMVRQVQVSSGNPGMFVPAFWRVDWRSWYRNYRFRAKLGSPHWLMEHLPGVLRVHQAALDHIPGNQRIHAAGLDEALSEYEKVVAESSAESDLAELLLPKFGKAAVTAARRETDRKQLLVACALERYRLKHGELPARLESLVPSFLERVPNDLFADGPLQYSKLSSGGYKLWSVGWDEKDEGGKVVRGDNGEPIFGTQSGDWVWQGN